MYTLITVFVHFNRFIDLKINFHTNPYNLASSMLLWFWVPCGQCLKILTQFTIEDENELAEIRGVFSQKNYEQILWQWQQTYLEKLLCLLQRFIFYQDQRRKDGDDFETDTVSSFQNTPELKRAKTYSALSFDRITSVSYTHLTLPTKRIV